MLFVLFLMWVLRFQILKLSKHLTQAFCTELTLKSNFASGNFILISKQKNSCSYHYFRTYFWLFGGTHLKMDENVFVFIQLHLSLQFLATLLYLGGAPNSHLSCQCNNTSSQHNRPSNCLHKSHPNYAQPNQKPVILSQEKPI